MKKLIDAKEVEKRAKFGCPAREIAAALGCTRTALEKCFGRRIARWRAEGCVELRKLQRDKADEGNVPMMIWLGKQMLGQSDRVREIAEELPESFRVELDFSKEP